MTKQLTKEQILDKFYQPKMHWKSVNRANVLKAMDIWAEIKNKTGEHSMANQAGINTASQKRRKGGKGIPPAGFFRTIF